MQGAGQSRRTPLCIISYAVCLTFRNVMLYILPFSPRGFAVQAWTDSPKIRKPFRLPLTNLSAVLERAFVSLEFQIPSTPVDDNTCSWVTSPTVLNGNGASLPNTPVRFLPPTTVILTISRFLSSG